MFRKEFAAAETLEELKAIYKRLAMDNHPDKGGSVEAMKEINTLYDEFFPRLKDTHRNKDGEKYNKATDETPEEFKTVINELLKMAGIKIEIIGCFIWVSGDTKPHREELKKIGFKWHSKKQNWYKHPADYKKKSKKRYSMDEVRDMFGVRYEAETETTKAIPA